MNEELKLNLQLFADGEGQDAGDAGQDGNTETENNAGNAEQQETTEQEKTFTQAELDKLIGERLKREKSKQPPKEELEAFNKWKKSQQTEQEKLEEERKEFESVRQELSRLKNGNEVLKSGVDSSYADYVTFEVGKMEGDFTENLGEFIKNNPQYAKGGTTNTTPTNAGGQKVKNEGGTADYSKMSDADYYKMIKSKK